MDEEAPDVPDVGLLTERPIDGMPVLAGVGDHHEGVGPYLPDLGHRPAQPLGYVLDRPSGGAVPAQKRVPESDLGPEGRADVRLVVGV